LNHVMSGHNVGRRFRATWFRVVVLLLGLLALAACGGSSSSSLQQQSGVTITGSPPSAIGIGANWQYTASVSGTANQSVTWSLSPAAAISGTIDSSTGLYIAPPSVPSPATVTITATSQAETNQSAQTTVTVQANDPLGTVSGVTTLPSCVGYSDWNLTPACYQMTVSCPGVADITTYLKVINPSGLPLGTVLFGVGTGGSGLYDDGQTYSYGFQVVENIVTAGYNTVEVSFGGPFVSTQPNGWLQGPGGVRRLACRYATVANWVYNNPRTINPNPNNTATNSAPMCATGNSGGSGAIGYAVYEYGLDSELAMIEPTSGPPMARVDLGCSPSCMGLQGPICTDPSSTNNPSMCYQSADASVIDEAYQAAGASSPTPCTSSIAGNPGTDAASLFLSDSIVYAPGTSIKLPNTTVKMLFGDQDSSNAVPEGMTWEESVLPSSSSPNPLFQCLPNVVHDIPSYPSGAMQIATDIIDLCH
jgi:hypothetical protein